MAVANEPRTCFACGERAELSVRLYKGRKTSDWCARHVGYEVATIVSQSGREALVITKLEQPAIDLAD